jgi:hypothetical protein
VLDGKSLPPALRREVDPFMSTRATPARGTSTGGTTGRVKVPSTGSTGRVKVPGVTGGRVKIP